MDNNQISILTSPRFSNVDMSTIYATITNPDTYLGGDPSEPWTTTFFSNFHVMSLALYYNYSDIYVTSITTHPYEKYVILYLLKGIHHP